MLTLDKLHFTHLKPVFFFLHDHIYIFRHTATGMQDLDPMLYHVALIFIACTKTNEKSYLRMPKSEKS